MKLSEISVRRPVLAIVISLLLMIFGMVSLDRLAVREYPDVDRPVISIRTDFDGASPETMDQEVTENIEGAVARVSGVQSISSESSFGESRVTIEFGDDQDLNVAASDVSRRGAPGGGIWPVRTFRNTFSQSAASTPTLLKSRPWSETPAVFDFWL